MKNVSASGMYFITRMKVIIKNTAIVGIHTLYASRPCKTDARIKKERQSYFLIVFDEKCAEQTKENISDVLYQHVF